VATIQPDDVVLVTAAAGGIGTLLVQAARNAGARVIGAAGGPEKVARIGADLAVDYNEPGWTDAVGEVTVVLDGVGGALGRGALERLAVGGRLIVFGGASGSPIQFDVGDLYRRGLTVSAAIGPRILNRPGGIRELEALALAAAADGTLTPALHHFPLADAAAAHAAIENRATIGKVVLVP
jgi:NADPH2:quinone reductase